MLLVSDATLGYLLIIMCCYFSPVPYRRSKNKSQIAHKNKRNIIHISSI